MQHLSLRSKSALPAVSSASGSSRARAPLTQRCQLAYEAAPRCTACSARRYLFAAGGTGGHVFPAIAVADELIKLDPTAQIRFMGDKERIEAKFVPEAGYLWESIKTVPIHRPVASVQNIWNLLRLANAVWSALWRIRAFNPDVILGTGGYVAFPVCMAAWILRKPFYLHEANVLPGLANRTLARFSRGVFTAFRVPPSELPPEKCRLVGNPVRRQFSHTDRSKARASLGIGDDQLLVTVLGGSLGALYINSCIKDLLPRLLATLPNVVVHHQTGLLSANTTHRGAMSSRDASNSEAQLAAEDADEWQRSDYTIHSAEGISSRRSTHAFDAIAAAADSTMLASASGINTSHGGSSSTTATRAESSATARFTTHSPATSSLISGHENTGLDSLLTARYSETPFIDDMATQLRASDLVVARAGAITCSELLATHTPSILVPLPQATDNHQHFNAVSMDAMGAATMMSQDDTFTPDALSSKIMELLADEAAREAMRSRAATVGNCDAARCIAETLHQTALSPKYHPENAASPPNVNTLAQADPCNVSSTSAPSAA